MNTIETLFGGREIKVRLIDGTETEIKVRQIPIGEYETALKLLDNEIAFVTFVCEPRPKTPSAPKIETVEPEFYEALYAAALEVNAKGFFSWKARRDSRDQEKEATKLAALAGAEVTKELVMQSALAARQRLVSQIG